MNTNRDQIIDERTSVLRILDANANRATEGMRAIEEFARFSLDDQNLSRQCKLVRHEISETMASLSPVADRLRARETNDDVGRGISAPAEYTRSSFSQIVVANLERCQQALRSLEEYAKVLDVSAAMGFEAARYRVYSLAKALSSTMDALQKLGSVRLYVLISGCESPDEFERIVLTLIQSGTDAIQLREKHLGDRHLMRRARRLRELTRGTKTLFFVNDRPDIAAIADADGVHLGQDELPVKDARRVIGNSRMVGVSTHTLEQARQAVADGADYIGCGPTFSSHTKSFDDFPGLEFLQKVRNEIRLPAFAIGGITLNNLPQVLAAGFTRVAVSHAIACAEDPAEAIRGFQAGLAQPSNQ